MMIELLRIFLIFFFFSSRRRHTRSLCDWSSDVCSSDLSRLSLQEAKTPGAASAPDSPAPHPQAGPVPGTHRSFHERVKHTKRPPPPLAPRAAQLSRDLTGTSRLTSLFLRDTLASHQPPGPRPQVPLPDGIIFAGALVVRVRRAGRAGAEGGPPQASGRGCAGPGLPCPAGRSE